MIGFVELIRDFFVDIFDELKGTLLFDVEHGMYIDLQSLILCCIVLGLIVNVFWKGARS